MRRIICFALFGLLISSESAFPQARHFVRSHGRVFVHGPHFGWHHYGMFPRYDSFYDPYRFSVVDFVSPVPSAPALIVPSALTYVFIAGRSAIRPQLVFKDGTTYRVADFWRADDQLHFITSEEGGTKSVPRTVPFADLDLQRTTDANTAQGFKFRIRGEPIEQWLQHHPQEKTSKAKAANKTR
jgi:hypothetical protein